MTCNGTGHAIVTHEMQDLWRVNIEPCDDSPLLCPLRTLFSP